MHAKMNGYAGNYNLEGNFKNHPIEFNLKTTEGKGLVLHDGVGYENYGDLAVAGYYSYPRLDASGEIQIDSNLYNLKGNLWYDRQWNCSGVFDSSRHNCVSVCILFGIKLRIPSSNGRISCIEARSLSMTKTFSLSSTA